MLTRRHLLVSAAAAGFIGPAHGRRSRVKRPSLAITIDDFDFAPSPLLDAESRQRRVLAALARHDIKACGFPAGKHIDNPAGRTRLTEWASRGHTIGCHNYSHSYYSGRQPAEFSADLDRALPLVRRYATNVPLFRFPFLAEGSTREGRDSARLALNARSLANGHVTIDTSDWFISRRLAERLTKDIHADLRPYRRFYLSHLLERARYYDDLAQAVLGYSINHTILLHHNLASALFLGDALTMFKREGWQLIDASVAFAQPIFAAMPDIVPAGQSLIWQLAKASGRFEEELRYPGEDGEYEQPKMDGLGL